GVRVDDRPVGRFDVDVAASRLDGDQAKITAGLPYVDAVGREGFEPDQSAAHRLLTAGLHVKGPLRGADPARTRQERDPPSDDGGVLPRRRLDDVALGA